MNWWCNMQWMLEGLKVTGMYLGDIPVSGKVRRSLSTYGGGIKHYVDLDTPVKVFGSIRETVILNHEDIETVRNN